MKLPPSSLPLIHKFLNFFDTRNFMKQRRVTLWSFSVLWDTKFSEENRDVSLLGIKFFDTPNWWNTKRFPYEMFRHWETKNFRWKLLILPPLIHKLFGHRKFSDRQRRRVHLRKFSALWDKRISKKKSWHNPVKHKIFPFPKLVTH